MARKKRGSAAARAAAAKRASLKSANQKKQDKQEEEEVPDEVEDENDTTMDDSTAISTEVEGDSETTEEVPNPPETTPASQVEGDEEVEEKIEDLPEGEEAPEAPEEPEDPPPEEPGTSQDAEDTKVTKVDIEDTPVSEPVASTSTQVKVDIEDVDTDMIAPSTIGERDFYVDTLLTDKDYLVDVSLGYAPVSNLKQPLKCFTATDELQLFPVIESMSAKLYTIVQKMNACQKRDVEAAIKAKKGIIKFPPSAIRSYLCHMNSMEAPSVDKLGGEDKGSPQGSTGSQTKRAPHPFLLTEDENMFSEEKLKMLRAVLDAGWKREVVMRSPGSTGRKTGDVYYYSPDGTKFRSSKQVEKHLQEGGASSGFTIENFTFAKVRISTNPEQEIVRKAYDGKSPPRAPPKVVSSKAKAGPAPSSRGGGGGGGGARAGTSAAAMMEMEEPITKQGYTGGRRAIQPPKRYSGDAVLLLSKRSKIQDDRNRNANANKGLMQMGMLPPKYPKGMEDSSSKLPEGMDLADLGYMIDDEDSSGSNSVAMKEIAEDSLFQISALRQSGGIDVDNMQQLVENQKQLAHKAQHGGGGGGGGPGAHQKAGSSKRGGNTVIPCSIRCPGMEGAVPNLNCSRCLCLFHAECLGLPPNLAFNKYLCSNCTEQHSSGAPSSSSTSSSATSQQKSMMIMKKAQGGGGEIQKRSPPGLAPIAHGNLRGAPASQQTSRGDITVTMTGGKDGGGGGGQGHGGHGGGHMTRIPQGKMVAVARGMIRNRGMPPPPSRAPAHAMHRQMAMMEDGGGGGRSMGGSGGGGHHPHSHQQQQHPAHHQQMIKRGRGRPPSVPQQQQHHPQQHHHQPTRSLPQLSKNLTITHLPRIGGGPPSLPSLQSKQLAHHPKAKIPLPISMGVGGKPRQAVIPAVPKLMKSSAFRLAVPPPSLSGRTFKKTIPSPAAPPSNLRLQSGGGGGGGGGKMGGGGGGGGGVYTHGPPHHQDKLPVGTQVVKRYPQSVCTIGNKKFVVLPKRRAADFVPSGGGGGGGGAPIGNGGFPKGITVTEASTVKVENNGGAVTMTTTLKKVGGGGGGGAGGNGGVSELIKNNLGEEGGAGGDNLMTDELMDGGDGDEGNADSEMGGGDNVEGEGDEGGTPMEEGEELGGEGAILNNSAVGEPISANQ